MRVLVCDPLVAEPDFVSMSEITQQADVITFHVPLTHEGNYATWHMANEAFFASLARRPFIINSSRGGVVNEQALHKALDSGVIRQAVIDTWENEPCIDLALLNKVYIGTPHIAGYSADGKANATNMSVSALCRHFGIAEPSPVAPPALPSDFVYTGNPLELYNPLEDSIRLKQNPSAFEQLRGDYPLRRESVFAQTHTMCAK
jgi:erythronate-4-phosphate dehydrogenase